MIVSSGIVLQQQRGAIVDADKDVQGSIIIKITNRHAPRGVRLREDGATGSRNVFKSLAVAAKEKHRLAVLDFRRVLFDFVVGMPINKEQVEIAVIVVVEVFHSPAAHQLSHPPNTS